MKATDLPIYHGGLMRCCLATLEDVVLGESFEGTIVPCKWCHKDSMILDRNNSGKELAWRWNRPASLDELGDPPVV